MKLRFIVTFLYATLCTGMFAQNTPVEKNHFVMRSSTFGIGSSNVYDTYLTPLEYKGVELRYTHESMRMTKIMKGNVSGQSLFNAHFSMNENKAETADMYYGMLSYSYALHYQFKLSEHFKLLAGPYIDINAGFLYNTRNSNNPAQAKVYSSIGASGMAIYKFKIRNYPMTVRYQADAAIMGMAFSPQYGQSYYEIFSLGHYDHNAVFTSLHNSPSLRQMVTIDFPLGNVILRAGFTSDVRQFKMNELRSHAYSNNFMIGFVRNLYRIKGKNKISMPQKYTPF